MRDRHPAEVPAPSGLIEDDVNVRERAALWVSTASSSSAAAGPVVQGVATPASAALSPAKRIRDRAALFEKESA